MLAENVVVVTIQSHVVLLYVRVEVFSSQNFRDLDELVVVVFSLEEWLLLKDHTGEHATQRPNVE